MNATAKRRIPAYISEQYPGRARQFKAERRKALKQVWAAFRDLRRGSAWFPGSYREIDKIYRSLRRISDDICEKNWGR
ncbi:MAG: hypothetical protein U0990_09965 [Candidatus Nanopelagicales bacterium]|nr:hypothetical protein [Candidatus Nanopelagicales bacterium]